MLVETETRCKAAETGPKTPRLRDACGSQSATGPFELAACLQLRPAPGVGEIMGDPAGEPSLAHDVETVVGRHDLHDVSGGVDGPQP